ncbi:MAG: serine/threonine protein kinase [Planctomycetota bacterium]|jgi:serine/threonine-protein kinase
MIGEKLGKYRITGLLGRGGMGAVYLAEEPGRRRPAALKLLDPRFAEGEEAASRFTREATILAELDHPNIVRLLAPPARSGSHLFFVMEYVEGRTVHELLAEAGWFGTGTAVQIGLDLLAGLSASHGAGVVHRDLKPGNVIVKKSGKSKITDFGLGLFFGATRFTASGEVFGTPAYMSPEQAEGGAVDHRTDLHAVGVMLYEMLTGSVPYSAEHPLVLMRKIVEERPRPVDHIRGDVPRDLVEIVGKAMSKDPADRFQAAHEMRAALENVELGADGEAWEGTMRELVERETAGVAVPKPRNKGRRVWALVAAVILLAGFGIALWLAGRNGEEGGSREPAPVRIPKEGIRENGEPGVPEKATPESASRKVVVVLESGRELQGEFLEGDEKGITLRDSNGKTVRLAYGEISRIDYQN